MRKISCFIIDDEPPAIQLLNKYCSMVDQLEVVDTFGSAIQAFDKLNETTIDLLFLDIQMPIINGLAFLKSLQNPPSVILTTAYREYAVEAYDLDIIDYLLKPIPFDRFLKSIDRYKEKGKLSQDLNEKREESPFIFFNINKKQHKVVIDDITYLESLKDYVRIHTLNETLVVKGNLGSIFEKFPIDKFIRIHRSYAIAIRSLKSYNQKVVDLNGITLPIGESYKSAFMDRFKI